MSVQYLAFALSRLPALSDVSCCGSTSSFPITHRMHRLDIVGFGVGVRLLELLSYRERSSRRDLKLLDALRFVHTTLWRYLFGRPAKDLEQSNNVRAGARVWLARLPRCLLSQRWADAQESNRHLTPWTLPPFPLRLRTST